MKRKCVTEMFEGDSFFDASYDRRSTSYSPKASFQDEKIAPREYYSN